MTSDTTTKRKTGGASSSDTGARDGTAPATVVPPAQRALARQQRLGILHNPNRAPAPPARRAPLMGKWFSLQSSRRPQARVIREAAEACHSIPLQVTGSDGFCDSDLPQGSIGPQEGGAAGAPIISLAPDDRLRIDTARLMAAIAGHGRKQGKRRPFAEGFTADPGVPSYRAPPLSSEGGGRTDGQTEVSLEGPEAPVGGSAGRSDADGVTIGSGNSDALSAGPHVALAAAVRFPRLPIGRVFGPAQTTPEKSALARLKRSLTLNGIAFILISAAALTVFLIARLVPAA